MNKNEIITELRTLHRSPNKRLGQNFLIDKNILQKIVAAADLKDGERVLEIGPGLGVLTDAMIGAGAEVTAIEKDSVFAERLMNRQQDELVVIYGDAAKLDWEPFTGSKHWKFVSNLPYAITSLALRKALYIKKPPKVAVALIQKEVADRIMEPVRSGKMSLLALMCHLATEKIERVCRVSKNSFYPSPKVESAVIKMTVMSQTARKKKWGMDPEEVMKIAKQGFSHPRKLLQRNLNVDHQVWATIVDQTGIKPKARAEDLSVEEWVQLAHCLNLDS